MDKALKKHLGRFAWEKYLDPDDLELLALHRRALRDSDESYFAREFARILSSVDFREALEDAKRDGDPKLKAYTYFEAELSAYPYRLELL